MLFLPLVLGLHSANGQVRDSINQLSPKKALYYSALFPGLGQLYVGKPLKAAGFVLAEGYFITNFFYYNRIYGYIKETKTKVGLANWRNLSEAAKKDSVKSVTGYSLQLNSWRPREKRNKYAWWSIGVYVFGMLDAFVDAHLTNFPSDDVEFSFLSDNDSMTWQISFDLRKNYGR